MAIKSFTSGEVLTASDTNTYLANAGLVYVTSVALSSTGANIDSCFTSTYTNYRVVIEGAKTSSGNSIVFGLRASGATNGTNYSSAGAYALYAGSGGYSVGASNFWIGITASASLPASGSFDIYNPAVATQTSYQGNMSNFDAGAYIGGVHSLTNAYDGIAIIAYGATISAGRVTIYGYRKN